VPHHGAATLAKAPDLDQITGFEHEAKEVLSLGDLRRMWLTSTSIPPAPSRPVRPTNTTCGADTVVFIFSFSWKM